ncbi:TlpA disulfide reductase family protein [Labilibaculum sp. K2S]|uniref:TlpA disulfide reductase family protein n=1 Tax=Labilibaculum sp. K2S TaxID=3056386 RepID=UPI0025A3FFC7|nr:TlpA disulfide reductase family protein [Labilibaculum sp. K2S]MDM8161325.1 TlpA disulfide reductase family protein [Labilibaculum sp. K2S]
MNKVIIIIGLVMGLVFSGMAQTQDSRGYIVKVGDMAPDFEMNLTDGSTLKLSDLKGKVVMLQFTASWCGVCRKEMPFIEKEIWQDHKEKEFALYALDLDEPLEKAEKLIAATGITYPVALDKGAGIFTKYAHKESGVTRNVIVNKEGKIIYLTRLFNHEEFDGMKMVIEAELKK